MQRSAPRAGWGSTPAVRGLVLGVLIAALMWTLVGFIIFGLLGVPLWGLL